MFTGIERQISTAARIASLVLLAFCSVSFSAGPGPTPASAPFTIAVVSDTQNYLDFRRQRATGYPFDAREMFRDQMAFLARNLRSAGGDIAFVSAVGDIRQTPSGAMDPAHVAEGLKANPDHSIGRVVDARAAREEFEIARQGYDLLKDKVPFSVVPGNHDYDAAWADPRFTSGKGQIHFGGLSDFTAVFGARSTLFRGQSWYVDHFNGGADSAQIFEAGGYRFLHIGLEMAPYDDVLEWASRVIGKHPGLPTIITTHDYLSRNAERKPLDFVDLSQVQQAHNTPEQVWSKLISRHRQIFLVLCGHQTSQARRVDAGEQGGLVWQLLSDYQERAQTVRNVAPNGRQKGTGDGWLRLMTFDLANAHPSVRVRTYSTYFHAYASDLPLYAQWYKADEQPQMTDAEFLAQDEFTIELTDFHARFGLPKADPQVRP